MSRWTPCKRREFIRRLRVLGFEGPFSGTRHQFLTYQLHRLTIPSNEEYSVPQLCCFSAKWKASSNVRSALKNGMRCS